MSLEDFPPYTDENLKPFFQSSEPLFDDDTDDDIEITGVVQGDGDCTETVAKNVLGEVDFNKNQAEKSEAPEDKSLFTNYSNPTALDLFQIILSEPSRYEVTTPLKGCRENKVYTVKGFALEEITCDDNGAYNATNTSKATYIVKHNENGVEYVRGVLAKNDAFYYKERVGRQYVEKEAPREEVYTLHRYYRTNKSMTGLKMMVVRVEALVEESLNPYVCVIYSRSSNKVGIENVDLTCVPHGNSKREEALSQPYYRTSKSVLQRMDKLLEKDNPSSVFQTLLMESGGPIHSTSLSTEPRNSKQVISRKNSLKRNDLGEKTVSKSNLDKLLEAQRDPNSLVRSVLVYGDSYIAFIYSDKQLQDIQMFCCKDTNSSIFGIDTTFKLCDMWLTDTSYRNQRLLSTRSGKHPVCLGPAMLHFTKDEETFRRFCAELLSANPSLQNLKKVGVDMESAIFNGFKGLIKQLLKLYCVRHLQPRDEKAIQKLFEKVQMSKEKRERNKNEIIKDIYGTRVGETYEYGLAEAIDEDDLSIKLESVKHRWEKLCPGFHKWFMTHRKKDFAESVVKSARAGTQVDGLFYQNDVESLHAIQKRIQCFKTQDVLGAVKTLETLSGREENDEVLALYGHSNYVVAPAYKRWEAPLWHSWPTARRQEHLTKFRSFVPSIEQSFRKPVNVGRKPGDYPRKRTQVMTTFVIDRHSSSSSNVSNDNDQSTTTNPVANSSALPSSTASSDVISSDSSNNPNGGALSFPDPRRGPREKPFELHLRKLLSKHIRTCRGNCGHPITAETILVVKSFGISSWCDKTTGQQKTKSGPLYIHFDEQCLKDFDSDNVYSPTDAFPFEKVTLDEISKKKMPEHEIKFLENMGVHV